ncbi:alpha/beta hydrolase family esterase [Leisingera daeponensis]
MMATATVAGVLAVLAVLWSSPAAAGCGGEAGICEVAEGVYRIALPDNAAGAPVVVFLHGYGSGGLRVMGNTALVEGLTARGYAVIAPDGTTRGGGSRRSWVFGPFWQGRDEAAFLADVLDDAAARFATSRERTVLAGFSSGAFMVNYLACSHPEAFAAYAPVSGAFWRPQPEDCAGPVRLFHSHGWADGVVPLEGRILGGGRFEQGDVFAGLELWRRTNGCASHAPVVTMAEDGVLRRRWVCGAGAGIELVLHEDGHLVPDGWPEWMADWFESEPAVR